MNTVATAEVQSNSESRVTLSEAEVRELEQEVERLTGRERSVYWSGKRLFDIVVSGLAILVLFPFGLVLSLIIYVDDPHGGPFYSQIRVGRHGRTFTMWKFRSMVVNADQHLQELQSLNEANGPVFKIKDDPRITRVGRFIRKYSIDELPQIFNVFLGHMSFVGPRPALPNEVAQYNRYQRLRLTPTPGLTCLWQISKARHDMLFDEWVALDVEYIRKRGWGFDLGLILRTFRVVFLGQSV